MTIDKRKRKKKCPTCSKWFIKKTLDQKYCSSECSRKAPSNGGRPPVMSEKVIQKLEQAFSIDCTIREACFYAGIAESTYYENKKKNPKMMEEMERLKNKPILKARQTIVNGLSETDNAKWYLERKRKNEFARMEKQDVTSNGQTIDFYKIPDKKRE